MKSFTYTITDELGIHARPAGFFIKLSKTFPCTIKMSKDGKSVDGKRLLAVMSLCVKQGHEITVSCDGEDEEKAAEALQKFLEDTL